MICGRELDHRAFRAQYLVHPREERQMIKTITVAALSQTTMEGRRICFLSMWLFISELMRHLL
jgi:hypothetical protein